MVQPVILNVLKKTKRCTPTRHHIIAKCLRNFFCVDSKRNIAIIEERKHRAFHQFFGENLTPQTQLLALFDVYENVLSGKARGLYLELVYMDKDDFYRMDMIRTRRKEYLENGLETSNIILANNILN